MSAPLRLVLFDVDGTLIDSQGSILAAMTACFERVSLPVPDSTAILAIVGFSLPHAMERLVPEQSDAVQNRLVAGSKQAYHAQRLAQGAADSPLYPGARGVTESLNGQDDILLGVATGKSQRGLDALLEAQGLDRYFTTRQNAVHRSSKPHPVIIEAAVVKTGVAPQQAVMVGDTSFDMDMASAAQAAGVGVSWGYHNRPALRAARDVIDSFEQLPDALAKIWN